MRDLEKTEEKNTFLKQIKTLKNQKAKVEMRIFEQAVFLILGKKEEEEEKSKN